MDAYYTCAGKKASEFSRLILRIEPWFSKLFGYIEGCLDSYLSVAKVVLHELLPPLPTGGQCWVVEAEVEPHNPAAASVGPFFGICLPYIFLFLK